MPQRLKDSKDYMRNLSKILNIYNKLLSHFGPQHWWPGDTPFEIMIGAILTQSTNWRNVEFAIQNLKRAKVLTAKSLLGIGNRELGSLIKPSGYYRQKAKKLKAFVKFFMDEYGGRISGMKRYGISDMRDALLKVHGIGPETADSILLYALDKPTFVVDAYTKRVGNRVGLFKLDDYHEIKEFFEQNLPKDLELYKEYHALLVELGKNYCKPKPVCKDCPINRLCKQKTLNG